MIASITGVLTEKSSNSVIIDVQGVGYQVHIPLSTFYHLPEISKLVTLKIYTHVREDALQLFGFLDPLEKKVFLLVLGISGVGPKLALNILSGLPLTGFIKAVMSRDVAKLASIPGVGKKTAERLALELKDRIGGIEIDPDKTVEDSEMIQTSPMADDAVSALINLGYKSSQAKDAIRKVTSNNPDPDSIETLITDSLRLLSK